MIILTIIHSLLALTVRFLTRRFIGEYDSTLGKSVLNTRATCVYFKRERLSTTDRKTTDGKFIYCVSETTQSHYLTVDGQFICLDILDTAGKASLVLQ